MAGRKKKPMKITCIEFTEGSLGPNPMNPFDKMPSDQRRALAIEEMGRILGEILAEEAGDGTEFDDETTAPAAPAAVDPDMNETSTATSGSSCTTDWPIR